MSIRMVVEMQCDNCLHTEIAVDFAEIGKGWTFLDATGTRFMSLSAVAGPFERQHLPETESSAICLCGDCAGKVRDKELQWNSDNAQFEPVPPSAQMTLDEVIA